jgi:predicted transcriptional regulator
MRSPERTNRLKLIISSISNSPKSIRNISVDTGIPIASVYRIIKKLDTDGFIVKCGTIDEFGVRTNMFKSKTLHLSAPNRY